MTARVIQGSFVGAGLRLPTPVARPKTMPRLPGPPVPAFAGRPPVVQPRLPGPPAPAFAARPPVAQRHGAGDSFPVDPGQLGLGSGGGRPLPEAVRGKMEATLGADFSSVRVHVGPQAERIGAIAFTLGTDIYFAPGRFQPDTAHGQQLLGHELAHVVQQRAGRVRNPLGSGIAVVQDRALEAEADRLGHRAAAHRVTAQAKMPPSAVQPSPPVRISPPIGTGPGSYRLTAGAGGRPVGSVMVHARGKGAVDVTDLGVDQSQRGHGIGRMLVASAAKTGQQFGRSKVTLAAQDKGSGHLTQWYKSMGFTQTGVNSRGYPQFEAPISRVLAGVAQRSAPQCSNMDSTKSHLRVIQRMMTGVTIDTNEIVRVPATGQAWGSRPPTNARGQQSHRSAYVLFQQGVRTALHMQSVQGAFNALKQVLEEYRGLVGIENARADLITAIDVNQELLEDPPVTRQQKKALLAQVAYNALAIRQGVPGSVGTGSRVGHDESSSLAKLNIYEQYMRDFHRLPWGGTNQEMRHLMWRMFDYDPPPNTDADYIGGLIWNHFLALRTAFPNLFQYLSENSLFLMTFLRGNRGLNEMPLGRVPDSVLQQIENDIHANWQ